MTIAKPHLGLTTEEATRRRLAGEGNEVEDSTARSFGSIVRANVLTRFNAIIASLIVVVFVFGSPIDALFGLVMVLNSLIGIVQEVRAKRSLDALRVLVVPEVGVFRDGAVVRLAPADVVSGDVLQLESGDQIPVDGVVVRSEGLEVDESALTGESRPVEKDEGDDVLSGSFVVAGTAVAEAVRVGSDAWVQQITSEAKEYVPTQSELRVGVNRILGLVRWILPPLSVLLLWSQLRSSDEVADAMIGAVAGVVSLVPQGLVLLVSMTMAVAVVRLAANNVVVQELPAVEGLARVDVLCVDKTGTLTTGRLSIDGLEPLDGDWRKVGHQSPADMFRVGLAALASLESGQSPTIDVIATAVADDTPDWSAANVVPFSSVRKWSGGDFGDHGSWVLGAPEILLDAMAPDATESVRHKVDQLTDQARRVLLVGFSSDPIVDEKLPAGLLPVGLVTLKEETRPDAAQTMSYFHNQNVEVKVISGDHPRTVSAVASELGINGSGDYVDLRTVTDLGDLADVVDDVTVFGRVLPEQKRELVRLLQERGHTVAMTGDGVNDIPSLKAADIGIAMDTATAATKSTAQLVLLDGRFDRLPGVVAEGRRLIANMERVSALFITKTVYATILILVVGLAAVPFPLIPRHLSLVAALTIGIPAFILSFRSSDEPCRPGYLKRVTRFAIPAGFVAATATLAAYWAARSPLAEASLDQARTAATMTLTLTGLWILYRLVRPIDRVDAAIILGLLFVFVLTLVPSPVSLFYALPMPPLRTSAVIVGVLAAMIVLLESGLTFASRHRDHDLWAEN